MGVANSQYMQPLSSGLGRLFRHRRIEPMYSLPSQLCLGLGSILSQPLHGDGSTSDNSRDFLGGHVVDMQILILDPLSLQLGAKPSEPGMCMMGSTQLQPLRRIEEWVLRTVPASPVGRANRGYLIFLAACRLGTCGWIISSDGSLPRGTSPPQPIVLPGILYGRKYVFLFSFVLFSSYIRPGAKWR